jgi:hypothetical protein
MHGCFHENNVCDALNNAIPRQRRKGYIMRVSVEERRCAHGFASRIQRSKENRRPGAD